MAKISLRFHEELLQEFLLGDNPISIGRTDENEIIIKNLGVSRKHAQITKEGEDYFIEDMGSRNGTILNDKVIEGKTKLRNQDQIIIGKHQMSFFIDESQSISTSDPSSLPSSPSIPSVFMNRFLPPDETMRIATKKTKKIDNPDTHKIRPLTASDIEKADSKNHIPSSEIKSKILPQKRNVGVEILKGGIKQSKVKFDRLLVVAGKGPNADIRIKGDYEKDVVFIISTRSTGYFISPPKGIVLTVNGKEIHDYTKLEPGDILQAEETSMKFFQEL